MRLSKAMAVTIRLTRVGARNNPIWRVVAADKRSPRDGRFLEVLGHYNPQTDPSTIVIDEERVRKLAQPGRPAERHRQAAAEGEGDRAEGAARVPRQTLVDQPDQVEVREYRGRRATRRARAERRRGGPRQGDRPPGPHGQGAAQRHEGRWGQRRKADPRRDRRLGPQRGHRRLHPLPGVVRLVPAPAPRAQRAARRATTCACSTTATRRRSPTARSTTRRTAAAPGW